MNGNEANNLIESERLEAYLLTFTSTRRDKNQRVGIIWLFLSLILFISFSRIIYFFFGITRSTIWSFIQNEDYAEKETNTECRIF
jgi:hypothetical protein